MRLLHPLQVAPGAFAAAFSFVAGFTDSVGFVAFGFFPAHMTGNFVLVGDAFARSSSGIAIRLIAIAGFTTAVACTVVLAHATSTGGSGFARQLTAIQAAILCLFACSAAYAITAQTLEMVWPLLAAFLAAAAMGMQSASTHLIFSVPISTTAMTGNLTALVLDATSALLRPTDRRAMNALFHTTFIVSSFAMGALVGAFSLVWLGFCAMVIPILVLVLLARYTIAAPTGPNPAD